MRFGNCSDCREYKHLVNGTQCSSCSDSTSDGANGNWAIIYGAETPSSGHVCSSGLTESKAKRRASNATNLYPYKMN